MRPSLQTIVLACIALVPLNAFGNPGPLPRSTPEVEGVASAQLLKVVEALDADIEGVHSVMIVRHGSVIAEGWWEPYAAEHNHVLYSLSKSFTSTAVGMAVAEGKLSIDDTVSSFFPDAMPGSPSNNLKQMRVRDLLSMSTGHQQEPSAAVDKVSPKSFLAEDVPHKPGTHFKYNTAATFMLSAIVQKQTGQGLADYLKPRLFEPLGIEQPVWDTNIEGVALGGYGLRARTEDIAKLGQLYLQQGEWHGRRLIGRDWVALATSRQVSNGSNPDNDWDQGYGFQFWQCRHGAYRGDGAFGQYCVVLPDQDAVVAITSGLGDMQAVLNILWDKLLPAFHDVPLPEASDSTSALKQKLGSLELRAATGDAISPMLADVVGKTFRFPENEDGIESISLKSNADGTLTMMTKVGDETREQSCAHGEWKIGGAAGKEPTAGSFGWESKDTLLINLCQYETPFVITLRLRFADDDHVTFEQEWNVRFGPRKLAPLTGTTSN